MAKGRKTIEVEFIKDKINHMLSLPLKQHSKETKAALCTLLEDILHQSNNYHGFQYNIWDNGGYEAWKAAGEPDFPEKEKYLTGKHKEHDYSRVYY